MAAQTTLTMIKRITVNPAVTRRHSDPTVGMYTTQEVNFHFHDDSLHTLRLHLDAGLNALAMGELITNKEVTA
ncbi:hypothetical protein BCF11_2991 [Collimonas sp. PA-H2]|uniref:hypothetical protein n=1 Tax=Collimonas sp. PA-H2 TaxID=1881062 RepID=UPI000BF46342|nr:hypothetical protein [Collimonas sp. PA-H2]PFH10569.1 hypothetical protein BCF11_2991 [Collimonas sp. PA-H2]